METFQLRPYTPTDAQSVVDLINAASLRTVGFRRAVVDAVGNIWAFKYVPFSSEKVVAVTKSGKVVGYAYFSQNDCIAMETGGAVHPDYQDQEVGSKLIDWAETKAISVSLNAPADVKSVLQVSLYREEYDAIELFKNRWFSPVREWIHLVIELTEPPVVPALSNGLTLRQMDLDNDWDIVGPAMDEAFADHWGAVSLTGEENAEEEQEQEDSHGEDPPTDDSYSNAPGYCFIILDSDIVAGGILCNAKLVERSDTGRVGSIFVRPAYRRRGIAKVLMLTAFDAFWKNGFRRIITDTDANSFTNSTRLYTGLGMKPYRSEFTYEKEIRPGKEIRRLEA